MYCENLWNTLIIWCVYMHAQNQIYAVMRFALCFFAQILCRLTHLARRSGFLSHHKHELDTLNHWSERVKQCMKWSKLGWGYWHKLSINLIAEARFVPMFFLLLESRCSRSCETAQWSSGSINAFLSASEAPAYCKYIWWWEMNSHHSQVNFWSWVSNHERNRLP